MQQECSTRRGSRQLQASVDLSENASLSNPVQDYKRVRNEHRRSVTEAVYCE